MPSGRTHDSITLWSLPLVAGVTFYSTQSSSLTLFVAGSYLFSGLMFGPDLDVHSCQYRRWGVLRWIWLPYRRSMRHRSFWSHGPIVGTIVRLVYLLIWVALFGAVLTTIGAIAAQASGQTSHWQLLAQQWCSQSIAFLARSTQQYPAAWIAIGIGLELGAISHSLSDWTRSRYKRLMKRRTQPSAPYQDCLPPDLTASDRPDPEKPQPSPAKPPLPNRPQPPTVDRREAQLPPFMRRRE